MSNEHEAELAEVEADELKTVSGGGVGYDVNSRLLDKLRREDSG